MGIISLVFGLIGGLCAITGIVSILGIMPPLAVDITWTFWFALSVIMLLISIAFGVARGGEIE